MIDIPPELQSLLDRLLWYIVVANNHLFILNTLSNNRHRLSVVDVTYLAWSSSNFWWILSLSSSMVMLSVILNLLGSSNFALNFYKALVFYHKTLVSRHIWPNIWTTLKIDKKKVPTLIGWNLCDFKTILKTRSITYWRSFSEKFHP